tara:strand:- start:131 stop:793 length:663 start_codon:yes stop_codon:yes gene_type:complete
MLPFENIEKQVNKLLRAKHTFEELYYATLPRTHNNSTEGKRGFTDEIEPFIRKATLNLSKGMDDDESVVYSNDKKEAMIVKKKDVSKYIDRGYILIHEEANVAPVPIDGQFQNTDGSFDRVAGKNKLLRGKNKKELRNYTGKKFKVSSDIFRRFEEGHIRYDRWDQYIEEEDDSPIVDTIKKYSLRNPTKPVVIENCESGEVVILRRRTNDSRLKHNRRK